MERSKNKNRRVELEEQKEKTEIWQGAGKRKGIKKKRRGIAKRGK